MQIHSIRLTIQDVVTSDNVPVVALLGAVYIDDGKKMVDDEGNTKLDEDGNAIPDYEKINFTSLLSQNPTFKKEIQKMAIEAITLHNLEQAKKDGKELEFLQDYGLGLEKPKPRGSRSTPAKKRK